ncbi:1,2-phenylacetyl-CoA epoxidase subunit PaaD [Streptomyces sp. NPDC048197]|uniref:1,2-phenylacetyl-CoA epoxidase subunit PaaD n=1 Tax=Streptomyces sp. NPDC048197 TaxID=3365511 RepID=UPI00371CEBE8
MPPTVGTAGRPTTGGTAGTFETVGTATPTAPATPPTTALEAELLALAGSVPDPELPVLTLAELGVLRALRLTAPDRVEVELTPTYTGCPAIEAMSADIERILHDHGIPDVEVRTVLSPPWTTDAITAEGRRKLADFGIAPPRPAGPSGGPVSVTLTIRCPHCGSTDTTLLSRFSSTACKALRRCESCREPFDHFKEL